MNIIGAIIQFFIDSLGQSADTEEKTSALIFFQVIIGFIIAMVVLLWLFYRFM